nr:HAMP domain-containing histidine kinase [Bacteroidota bacterium]
MKQTIFCNIAPESGNQVCHMKSNKKRTKEINNQKGNHPGEPEQDFASRINDLEQKLRIANRAAYEYKRMKSTFISNISHEMRTPLNAILGFSELSQMVDVSQDEMVEYMKIIHYSSEQLLETIIDVIFLATLDAGEIKTEFNPISVNSLLQDLQEYYRYLTKQEIQESVDLQFNFSKDSDILINNDFDKLHLILKKLIDNALKFTEKGSVAVGFQHINGNLIQFSVEDTGIGIPADKIELIFEPFRSVDESHCRQYGGTGLGLSIVQRLVKLLSGELKVTSQTRKGTRIFITVPCNTNNLQNLF